MTNINGVQALESQHILQLYRRAPIVLARGAGCWLFDVDDRAYLDFVSGIGVAALGHAHPGLAEAIADQAATLVHTSNLYFHQLQGEVASRLARLSGLPRAFLCNSGTEAVEASIKFARRYWSVTGHPRQRLVSLEHGFHGRTCGSLSVTSHAAYRQPFEPMLPDVAFVSPDDPDALRAAVTDTTAAVILEPIQGEGGVRPLTPGFARAVGEACRSTGALLIADEVQCGLGRTGHAFYFKALDLQPDLVAVGKALGGGMPVGATLVSDGVAEAISYGDHGSTYGGNPLACRAALVVLQALVEGGLLARVKEAGSHLARGLHALAGRHRRVVDVRGAGLMQGLELSFAASAVVDAARSRGLLVNATATRVVRLLPPFTITDEEIDEGLARLEAALLAAAKEQAA